MRSRLLSRRATKETVAVEPFSSVDGQGSPSYATSQNIEARVVPTSELVVLANGTEVRATLTLYVPGDENPLPDEQDRVTYDGSAYIVMERTEGRRLDSSVDHVRLRCRDE